MRLQSNNGITSDILGASALVSVPPVAQKSSYKSKCFLLVSLQDASWHKPSKRRAIASSHRHHDLTHPPQLWLVSG